MARGNAGTGKPVAFLAGSVDKPASGVGSESATGNGGDGSNRSASGPAEFIIDPASIGTGSDGNGGTTGNDTGPKRRGRKPGSRNSPKAVPANIDAIEALLYSVHQMLAFGTGVAELSIEHEEAHSVAAAYVQVARHYPVLQQSEKVLDWGGLLSALGMVYGTRLYAMRMKPRPAKPAQPQAQPKPGSRGSNVVEIPGLGKVDTSSL